MPFSLFYPSLFLFIFGLVQANVNTFFQHINVNKSIQSTYNAGIRTHNLQSMSLLPLPLHQGTRPSEGYLKLFSHSDSFQFCLILFCRNLSKRVAKNSASRKTRIRREPKLSENFSASIPRP